MPIGENDIRPLEPCLGRADGAREDDPPAVMRGVLVALACGAACWAIAGILLWRWLS